VLSADAGRLVFTLKGVLATLTGGLNLQHWVFYQCILIIAVKRAVSELGAWDRRTDRQTD